MRKARKEGFKRPRQCNAARVRRALSSCCWLYARCSHETFGIWQTLLCAKPEHAFRAAHASNHFARPSTVAPSGIVLAVLLLSLAQHDPMIAEHASSPSRLTHLKLADLCWRTLLSASSPVLTATSELNRPRTLNSAGLALFVCRRVRLVWWLGPFVLSLAACIHLGSPSSLFFAYEAAAWTARRSQMQLMHLY